MTNLIGRPFNSEDIVGWVNCYPMDKFWSNRDDWYKGISFGSTFCQQTWTIDKDGIRIQVPGYGPEDFSIEAVGNSLQVRSSDGRISHDFVINKDVIIDKIEARVEKGIMRITMPTATPVNRKIDVR